MSTKVHIVTIKDDLALPHVIGIRDQLIKSIDTHNTTVLQLTDAADIDLSGIQLLHSARRYAQKNNKEFHLVGDVIPLISDRLVKAGFISEGTGDGKELERRLFDVPAPGDTESGTDGNGNDPGDITDA